MDDALRRQTLLSNIAGNLVAAGQHRAPVSVADALMGARMRQNSMDSTNLRDALWQRRADREDNKFKFEQSQLEAAQAQTALEKRQLAQVGEVLRRNAGNTKGALLELYQLPRSEATEAAIKGLQARSQAVETFHEGDQLVDKVPDGLGGWVEQSRGKGGGQTINVGGENPYGKINQDYMKTLNTRRDDILKTRNSYAAVLDSEKLLDDDKMFTGMAADWKLKFAKGMNLLGADNSESIANTEAYAKSMGRQTAEIIKAFGSGTGLSDTDREYAEGISGGTIGLNKESMKKLIKLTKKYYKMAVDQYNSDAKRVAEKDKNSQLFIDLAPIELPELKSDGGAQPPEVDLSKARQAPDGKYYIEKDGVFYEVVQ